MKIQNPISFFKKHSNDDLFDLEGFITKCLVGKYRDIVNNLKRGSQKMIKGNTIEDIELAPYFRFRVDIELNDFDVNEAIFDLGTITLIWTHVEQGNSTDKIVARYPLPYCILDRETSLKLQELVPEFAEQGGALFKGVYRKRSEWYSILFQLPFHNGNEMDGISSFSDFEILQDRIRKIIDEQMVKLAEVIHDQMSLSIEMRNAHDNFVRLNNKRLVIDYDFNAGEERERYLINGDYYEILSNSERVDIEAIAKDINPDIIVEPLYKTNYSIEKITKKDVNHDIVHAN